MPKICMAYISENCFHSKLKTKHSKLTHSPSFSLSYIYPRTVHFQDTDAAGVVYFANILAMCHEAYEASLAAVGINLRTFFGGSEVAVPIVHASVDFLKPMFCGDHLEICLTSSKTATSEFEIRYQIFSADRSHQVLSRALTRHVCVDRATRKRCDLTDLFIQWFALSGAESDPSPADG